MANMYSSWVEFSDEPQLNSTHYMALYRFFCEHADLINNLIQFRYLSIDEQTLDNLKHDIPVLFEYECDIWWAAKLFSALANPPTLTRGQFTILDNIASQLLDPDGDKQLEGILRLYYDRHGFPDPPPRLSEQLFNYFIISADTLKWVIQKTRLACSLVSSYRKLRESTDQLNPTLTAVRVGDLPLSTAQSRGKSAYNIRRHTMEAAKQYFSYNIPYLRVDNNATSDFLASYMQGATFEVDIDMLQLCEWKNNNQLHLKFSDFTPISIFTWDDLGTLSQKIDDFFTTISTFNLSPAAIALQKIPQIKNEITTIRSKVVDLIGEDDTFVFESKDLQRVVLLSTDIEALTKTIMDLVTNGIPWSDIGIQKDELDSWRLGLMKLKKHIEEINSEKLKQVKASSELYTKTCKPRPIPKITDEESFANFYFVYKSEEKNYPTEELKISLLRTCISNKKDKTNTIHLTTSTAIMNYLSSSYGGFSTQIKMIIKSLSKLKKARNPAEHQENVSKVISTIMVLEEQKSLKTLKQEDISFLINQIFDTISQDYWNKYHAFIQEIMKENSLSQEEFQDKLDQNYFIDKEALHLKEYLENNLFITRKFNQFRQDHKPYQPQDQTRGQSSSFPPKI